VLTTKTYWKHTTSKTHQKQTATLGCLLSALTPLALQLCRLLINRRRSAASHWQNDESTQCREPLADPCHSLQGWSERSDTVRQLPCRVLWYQSQTYSSAAIAFTILIVLALVINHMGTTPTLQSTISTPCSHRR